MEQYKKQKELIKRLEHIKALKKSGKSLRQIGKKFGLSHQRIAQLLVFEHKIIKPLEKKCITCFEEFVTYCDKKKRCSNCSDLLKNKGGRDLVRFLVRLRDNFTCQDCGLVKNDNEIKVLNSKKKGLKGKIKSLDVHHLNGLCGKKSKGYDKMTEIPNLITLCHKCHYNRPEHKCKTKEWAKIMSKPKTKTNEKELAFLQKWVNTPNLRGE